jgi:rRNA maturation RNase YbeY
MSEATVTVSSRRRLPGVRAADVRRDAARMLRALDVQDELSIALVGDVEMQALNARYRGIERPTDVLAFAQREGDGALHRDLLGDVIVSLDTASRQAGERGVELREELRVLLAHGILHLLGYDHERSPAEARRMFAKQRRLLKHLVAGDGG